MRRLIAISLALLVMLSLVGCGGDLLDGDVDNEYTVRGLLLHNPNNNTSFCYAYILRETQSIPNLTVYLLKSAQDSSALAPLGGGAFLTLQNFVIAADSSYTLHAEEQFGDFFFSHALYIADTFRVRLTNPTDSLYSGGAVPITWNPPSQDFGYFVTVQAPTGPNPYTAHVSSTNQTAIPATAFINQVTSQPAPGMYRIYVVAYSQTFYSDAIIENGSHVFFPYPDSGFVNNIDRLGVSGRFGGAILSYYDSVRVQ